MFGIRQHSGVRARSGRRSSLRASLALLAIAPGLVLAGVGGYAATALLRHGVELRGEAQLAESLAVPAQRAVANLQQERRHTAVWQADPSSADADALETRRQQTDAAVEEYRGQVAAAGDGANAHVTEQARKFGNALGNLSRQRPEVDNRSKAQVSTFDYYTETIAHGIRLLKALSRTTDGRLAQGMDAVATLSQEREMISREDALLSAALTSERMSATTQTEFAGYVTARRLSTEHVAGHLPEGQARRYERLTASPQWAGMVAIEQSVTVGAPALPARADEWRGVVDRIGTDLRELSRASLDEVLEEGTARADGLLLRASAGAAVALFALALLAALLVRASRSMLRRLSRARESVREAGDQLPELAARLERGEDVGVTPAPPRDRGTDEIGGLADEVAALRQTAESTVIQQAKGREGTTKILVNLARRTQILVHREISMLDAMERTYEDSELLEKLFAVDHTATRVRRHAENLLLLGGSLVPRGQEGSSPLVDLLRSAVSETEQYLRVTIDTQVTRRSLVGPVGKDVSHLIAELIENGTSFSPPHTKVEVRAEEVPNGLVIEVEDRGLGMKAEDYDYHNDRLANPPAPEMVLRGEDTRLGLFVVARLAQRHGIEVSLRRSRYGGTCAIVLLPTDILEKPISESGGPGLLPAGARVVTPKAGEDSSEPPAPAVDAHRHPAGSDPGGAHLTGTHSGGTRPTGAANGPPDASGTHSLAATHAAEPGASSTAPSTETAPANTGNEHATPAEEDMTASSSPQVTSRGLPKRERGTNLVWQLQEPKPSHAPASEPGPQSDGTSDSTADDTADEASPEQLSSILAAIDRGAMRAQAAAAGDDRETRSETSEQSVPDVLPSTEDDRDADADPG